MHYLVNNGGKNLREVEEPVTRNWIRNGVRNVYGTEICAQALPGFRWTELNLLLPVTKPHENSLANTR